jgi:type I restriction enzyme S subunit
MPKLSLNASKKTKHTPAGEIPVDWGWATLDAVAVVQTGLSKSSNRSGDFVRLPYLRVANVQDGHFQLEEIKEIDVPKEQVERFLVRKGDLLLTEGGDFDKLGRGAVWNGQIESCVHQNHLFVVRGKPSIIDQRFLASYTQSPKGRSYFQSCSKQSTNLASINSSQLKQLPVPLPTVTEQRKIADILSTWDEALGTLDALFAAKDRQKQALMQQLLTGKTRVKGAKGKWKKVRFQELLKPEDRYVEFDDEHTYRLVSIRRRSGGVFFREQLDGSDIKTKVMKRVQTNDFLISRMQVVHGALGMVRSECDGMYASDSYDVLVAKDANQLHMPFLDWMSRLRSFWHLAYISSHGVHIEKMTFKLSDFMHEKILIPQDLAEQQQIAAILDTADQELTLLRTQRQSLDQQKRGLMQRLLTGKIRVKNQS